MTPCAAFLPPTSAPLTPRRTTRPTCSPHGRARPRTQTRAKLGASLSDGLAAHANALITRAKEDIALLHNNISKLPDASIALLTALALLASTPAYAEIPATAPGPGLYDDASIVQKGNEELFKNAAASIERNTGLHVRFVMTKSIPFGDTPSEYAAELFGQWALSDDDILFVASPKLARAGAAVGAHAAELLTPAIADSICNETYSLKAGDERYGAAILDVSNRLIPVLGGKDDPGPPDMSAREVIQNFKTKEETSKGRNKYVVVVGAILVIAFVAPLVQTFWYIKDD